jgi:hypothetical protein
MTPDLPTRTMKGLYKGEMLEITFHILDRDERPDYLEYQRQKCLHELFQGAIDKWGINAIVRYKEHTPRRDLYGTIYGFSAMQLNIDIVKTENSETWILIR